MITLAELEEKYDRLYALIKTRMDAVAKEKAKAKCRDKPLVSRTGRVVKPATIECGTVCRQKQNCKVTKGELRKVRSAFNGKSKREMAEAVKALIESKKAGQSSTRATYEATAEPLREKNRERREKRYQKSLTQAEKRAKAKSGIDTKEKTKMPRLEILKTSLAKKQAKLDALYEKHFADVKSANGQPLNDKGAKGQATLNRWEKQGEAITAMKKSIAATEEAIEKESRKAQNVEAANGEMPAWILSLVEAGELTQWRKYPNRFFVPGVDKARFIWDGKRFSHKYANQLPNGDGRKAFVAMWKKLTDLQSR